MQSANQVDAVGMVSAASNARRIVEAHKAALDARRSLMLIWEKLLLHIDGSGDFQWADIYHDSRVEIPRSVSGFRKTENLLRIIVDYAVAQHTSMPLRYFVDHNPHRRDVERAMIDMLWINNLAQQQDFNGLTAEALYLAMPAGFCPIHTYWREDTTEDWFQPLGYGGGDAFLPKPGMIDCWVGNPFSHVFDISSKRGSVRWSSYDRVVSADLARATWGHIPGVAGLMGSTRMPSASQFQQTGRKWNMGGLGVHGSPIVSSRRGDEELMTVICRETPPGADPAWPNGHLEIVLVPGEVDTIRGVGNASHAILVADQELPAADFSFSLFYSDHRADDVHGKPWVEDKDQVQVDYNITISREWEQIVKMAEAPIVAPGGAIGEDMTDLDGYALLEVEPSLAGWRPHVMEWPQSVLIAIQGKAQRLRDTLFTLGGYQAVSRGESPGSRMAASAIAALQEADRSVHRPVNMRFKRSCADFAQKNWKQFKAYGDVGWMMTMVGDEYAHMVEGYVDRTMLSERAPQFRLVSAFGTSPEQQGAEIIELMQLRGADGEAFLSTPDARRAHPNQIYFSNSSDPSAVKRRHAKTVASKVHVFARQIRQRDALDSTDAKDPAVQQAGYEVFGMLEEQYPRMRDDDLQAHIDALSEITQDDTADIVARIAATFRQSFYYDWQDEQAAQEAGMQMQMPQIGAGAQQALPPGRDVGMM